MGACDVEESGEFRSQPIQLFLIYFTAEIDAAFRIADNRIPKGLFGHPFFLRTGMDCSTATSGSARARLAG